MRKILLGLVATAAIASPIALATSASAATTATPGTIDTTTYSDATYHHVLTTDYTCGIADGHAVVDFQIAFDGGTGTGTLVPSAGGGGTFAFKGVSGNYGSSYAGTYDATGTWTEAKASAGFDGNLSEDYVFGTMGRTTGHFGSVIGSFTGIPNCPAPEAPATVTGNHGEYVSGAAHAGIKGKALAAIAKDVTLVGPYKG